MKINEVAPIFERINSTGRRLTIYDLMRAATWSGTFDLNNIVKQIKESLEQKQFDKILETHILRSISASAGYGINKADIENLRDLQNPQQRNKLQEAANACIEAYQLAVDFLTNELPVASQSYLPYALQLTYLAEFFRIQPKATFQQRETLKTWMWHTSLSGYFRSANTGQNISDLQKIRNFANGKINELNIDKPINFKKFVNDDFSLNKATSKTFALLLSSQKPKSLLDGSLINTRQALATANRHEYHHIFPQAYLKSRGFSQEKIDNHSNICLLNKGNNITISNQQPSIYFKEMANKLEDNMESILASNFIDIKTHEAALQDDYETFLQLRSNTLINAAKLLSNYQINTNDNGTDETADTPDYYAEDEVNDEIEEEDY
ncbi:MAG: hypothetical protein JNM06_10585 [Blastocatellia bacterium]|nr:hypothetical protein [Blastocatellia bacterium]